MHTITQKLIVEKAGQYSLPLDCNRMKDYDIKIKSVSGNLIPLLTDILFCNTHIKFFVDIEPGNTAEVVLTYQCEEQPKEMRMPGNPDAPYFKLSEKKKSY
jgi:hypothetical protein